MREEQAWLLQNGANIFPISGALELDGGKLSFTLNEMAAEANLGWLEKELGAEDLKSQIKKGKKIVAFDLPVDGLNISWPMQFAGSALQAKAERKWLVAFDYPSGGAISNLLSISSGRKKAKLWKKELAEAGAS